MQRIIVSDASCLIVLQKLDELPLLKVLFGTVITTCIIAKEFGLPLPDFIHIVDPSSPNVALFAPKLDAGESSAIALAIEKQPALLIIDEVKGRKAAMDLGIDIIGTAGLLIEGKRLGYIAQVKPYITAMRNINFRMHEHLEHEVLRLAGEL